MFRSGPLTALPSRPHFQNLVILVVNYESIRKWCLKFPSSYAKKLRKSTGRLGDAGHLDEFVINIRGERHYLLRDADGDGDTPLIDIKTIELRFRTNPLDSVNRKCGVSSHKDRPTVFHLPWAGEQSSRILCLMD